MEIGVCVVYFFSWGAVMEHHDLYIHMRDLFFYSGVFVEL